MRKLFSFILISALISISFISMTSFEALAKKSKEDRADRCKAKMVKSLKNIRKGKIESDGSTLGKRRSGKGKTLYPDCRKYKKMGGKLQPLRNQVLGEQTAAEKKEPKIFEDTKALKYRDKCKYKMLRSLKNVRKGVKGVTGDRLGYRRKAKGKKLYKHCKKYEEKGGTITVLANEVLAGAGMNTIALDSADGIDKEHPVEYYIKNCAHFKSFHGPCSSKPKTQVGFDGESFFSCPKVAEIVNTLCSGAVTAAAPLAQETPTSGTEVVEKVEQCIVPNATSGSVDFYVKVTQKDPNSTDPGNNDLEDFRFEAGKCIIKKDSLGNIIEFGINEGILTGGSGGHILKGDVALLPNVKEEMFIYEIDTQQDTLQLKTFKDNIKSITAQDADITVIKKIDETDPTTGASVIKIIFKGIKVNYLPNKGPIPPTSPSTTGGDADQDSAGLKKDFKIEGILKEKDGKYYIVKDGQDTALWFPKDVNKDAMKKDLSKKVGKTVSITGSYNKNKNLIWVYGIDGVMGTASQAQKDLPVRCVLHKRKCFLKILRKGRATKKKSGKLYKHCRKYEKKCTATAASLKDTVDEIKIKWGLVENTKQNETSKLTKKCVKRKRKCIAKIIKRNTAYKRISGKPHTQCRKYQDKCGGDLKKLETMVLADTKQLGIAGTIENVTRTIKQGADDLENIPDMLHYKK